MSISITYYSDVLCIWAYSSKIKIDEIKKQFAEEVAIDYCYTPLFVDMHQTLQINWASKGGLQGYNTAMLQLQKKFPHIEVHPEIGLKNLPYSSASCHLFLKSISLLEQCGEIASSNPLTSLMGQADWLVRLAYFRDALDISNNTQLMRIAEQLNIPRSPIEKLLNNGEGMAALSSCTTNDKQKLIEGSPSFVFNEGRQRLYGNIGYHIIAANIKALLEAPENKPSWY